MNNEMSVQGYSLKNVDFSMIPKSTKGVALWHMDPDLDLKIMQDPKNFKGILQSSQGTAEIRIVNSESLADFDKDFNKLRQTHTLSGIRVTSS